MKKIIVICSALLSLSVNAGNYAVPAIDKNVPLPLFSKETPLTPKEKQALRYSKEWINSAQYPYQNGQKVVFLHGAGQPTVVCAPLRECIIALEPGERISLGGVHSSDTRWNITPSVGGNITYVVIKPIDAGLNSDLALVTDRRIYHINLKSRRNDHMPLIGFDYPEKINEKWEAYYQKREVAESEKVIPATGENIADLDFNYKISGCSECSWRPLRVYNNRQQTIIQMPETVQQVDAPGLLVMTRQGEQMVNYRMKRDRYIVDQVFDEAVLIVGVGSDQDRVTIKRN